jgi:dihydroorotate dehydrogenase
VLGLSYSILCLRNNWCRVGPELYLEHIRKAKEAVAIPIIASLNGYTPGGWMEYAQLMQQAGADAIELNVYYVPTDPNVTGAEVEQNYINILRDVKAEVTIPVAIKQCHSPAHALDCYPLRTHRSRSRCY